MTTYAIKAPDGNTYQIDGPPGATDDQVREQVMKQHPTAGSAKTSEPKEAGGEGASGLLSTKNLRGALESTGPIGAGVSALLPGEPVTPGGKLIKKAFELPEKASEAAGEKTRQVAQEHGASPEESAIAGTTVKTGLAALTLLTPGGAARRAEITAAEAAQKAAAYVAKHTSLDWATLATGIKEKLTQLSKEAGGVLEGKLDPTTVEREARLGSLPKPVRATQGQISRDPVQLRNEGSASATAGGKPIADIHAAGNKDILENLDIQKARVQGTGKTSSTATTQSQLGSNVQKDTLRAKAAASKKNYDALYTKARATDPNARVGANSFYDMLEESPELQHLGFMKSWLKKAGVETTEKSGGTEVTTRRGLSLNELNDLRSKASGISKTGGTEGYYAGKVVEAIDRSMSEVPASAKAWKEAIDAFKEHKAEFSDQEAVAKLVENKTRTDPKVDLEETWKHTVIDSSAADLRAIKKSMLTGGDAKTRTAGRRAWRDIRAQTIQHIKDEATKSVTRYQDGTPNVTPASMERAIKSIGDEKLEEIFGKGTVREIKKIMEATRDIKTIPPEGFKGSPTFANLLSFFESRLNWIPGSSYAGGAVRLAAKVRELGKTGREAREAARSPLTRAVEDAKKAKKQRALAGDVARYTPLSALKLEDMQAQKQDAQ